MNTQFVRTVNKETAVELICEINRIVKIKIENAVSISENKVVFEGVSIGMATPSSPIMYIRGDDYGIHTLIIDGTTGRLVLSHEGMQSDVPIAMRSIIPPLWQSINIIDDWQLIGHWNIDDESEVPTSSLLKRDITLPDKNDISDELLEALKASDAMAVENPEEYL